MQPLFNSEGLIISRATIVVTPISIINQWIGEIRKHAPSLTVCIFDGSKAAYKNSLLQLAIADIVLSFSLSLSYTHKHTHTLSNLSVISLSLSLFLSLPLSLSLSSGTRYLQFIS